jgi:hypothetical protein
MYICMIMCLYIMHIHLFREQFAWNRGTPHVAGRHRSCGSLHMQLGQYWAGRFEVSEAVCEIGGSPFRLLSFLII